MNERVSLIVNLFIKDRVEDSIDVDFYKVQDYLLKYLEAYDRNGEFSNAFTFWKKRKAIESLNDFGTSIWAVNLMNALNMPTTPSSNIESFEKELTEFIKSSKE